MTAPAQPKAEEDVKIAVPSEIKAEPVEEPENDITAHAKDRVNSVILSLAITMM